MSHRQRTATERSKHEVPAPPDGFREYLRAHHFAARTLETYGANAKRFLAFLEQRYPRIDTVEQVTKDTILDYQRHPAEHEDPRIGR